MGNRAVAAQRAGVPARPWGVGGSLAPGLLLVLPAVAVVLSLYAVPFLLSVYRAFLEPSGQLGLASVRKAWELYRRDVLFSAAIALASTLVTAPLSIALAAYLRMRSGPVAAAVNVLYRLPIFIPFVVVGQMMTTFLAPHGLLNVGLAQLGLIDLDRPPEFFNWKGLIISFVWKLAPFMTLIVLGGFRMVEDTYIEAARSVGARPWEVVGAVLVPMSRTSIATAAVLVFTQVVGTFTLPYMLIGGKSPTTVTVDIAHRVTYFGDYGTANALGLMMYVLTVVAALYYLRQSLRRSVYGYQ